MGELSPQSEEVHMTMVRKELPSHLAEWPVFTWPERWRRLSDFMGEDGWMRVEEFHDDETLVVRVEMPDIDPDKDVEVTTSGGVVKIRARREAKTERTEKHGYRSEFRYGEFERDVMLPEGADAKDVTATYKDGILEVRVPYRMQTTPEPTTIPVTRQ